MKNTGYAIPYRNSAPKTTPEMFPDASIRGSTWCTDRLRSGPVEDPYRQITTLSVRSSLPGPTSACESVSMATNERQAAPREETLTHRKYSTLVGRG